MSGRGGGRYTARGRNRDGCGHGRGRFNRSNNKSNKGNNQELKFMPHGGGRDKFVATYVAVRDPIVQYVQKNYKYGQDIAESIRDMKKIDIIVYKPIR